MTNYNIFINLFLLLLLFVLFFVCITKKIKNFFLTLATVCGLSEKILQNVLTLYVRHSIIKSDEGESTSQKGGKKMKKKQKRMNKLFELLGKVFAFILFSGMWSLILYFGFIVNTIY